MDLDRLRTQWDVINFEMQIFVHIIQLNSLFVRHYTMCTCDNDLVYLILINAIW